MVESGQSKVGFAAGVIHYRDPDSVLQLIASHRTWSSRPEVFVIADNSGEFLTEPWRSTLGSNVEVIDMHGNRGYAAAANAIISRVSAVGLASLLLLTQDARLEDSTAELLWRAEAEHHDVAVALPILAFASTPTRVFSAGGILAADGSTRHINHGELVATQNRRAEPYDVQWGDGACMMLTVADVLSVGGLDESYFLYVEEIDLHVRLRKAGRRIRIVPAALAFQEPGDCSIYYKYRNRSYFTAKFPNDFDQFRWYKCIWRDVARVAWRDGDPWGFVFALRGLADYRGRRMGTPRPLSPFSGLFVRPNRPA